PRRRRAGRADPADRPRHDPPGRARGLERRPRRQRRRADRDAHLVRGRGQGAARAGRDVGLPDGAAGMRALRALFLFAIALALAWLAGWGMPGSELSAPAAVASFASLGMAIAPRAGKGPAPTAGKSG